MSLYAYMTLKQSSDDCENLIKLLKTIEKKHVYLIVHLTTGLRNSTNSKSWVILGFRNMYFNY